jgi:hypothetical protein
MTAPGAGDVIVPVWANPKAVAGRAAEPVVGLWHRLASRHGASEPVDPAAVDALPDPARNFVGHAIAEGAPAANAVLLG